MRRIGEGTKEQETMASSRLWLLKAIKQIKVSPEEWSQVAPEKAKYCWGCMCAHTSVQTSYVDLMNAY